MNKRIVILLSLIAFVMTATGCNTVEGMGKDIKDTGAAIENAAQKSKSY